MTDTLPRVIDLLDHLLATDRQQIIAESKLAEDIGADSLDNIEIMMECEDEFHIVFNASEFDGVVTVGDLVNLVDSKRAA